MLESHIPGFLTQKNPIVLKGPKVLRSASTCISESFFVFKKLGFTPCKAEQPQQGMELQEKETQKD